MVHVRYFGYLGGVLLALTAAFVVGFGLDALHGLVAVQLGLLALAGLCCVAGGFANPLRERVGALRLVGFGDVVLGASMAVSALTVGEGVLPRVVPVLGGLCIALIGVNYVADGRFFEVGGVEV
ncbi:hypothetical protein [Halarchaeum nitratireducens]|uniref:Uncharacterized protein n=1 Tax=Halarchaeum nitratireducens TaxID=489913 RepID=A0A830GC62_9EURY|nr:MULTISPECIES: hypothetical protein [Halarchaeum]MBP2252270.1 hypothetical protein [Halarchaeum solikamskense]GGN17729.1 hypothetical protein GCM10009021_18210 [Halarchaeum nitratireducens]